jgi:hypothetical protein
MHSSAHISTVVQGLDVQVVGPEKVVVRAIVTRQALEAHWGLRYDGDESMLLAFDAHQDAIERAVLERYATQRRGRVLIHASPPKVSGERGLASRD